MEKSGLYCAITWLFCLLTLAFAGNTFFKIDEFLESEKYDRMLRPNAGGSPVVVTLELYVIDFGLIEEVNLELPVYFYLRQSWVEPRFINQLNSTRILNRETLEKVWRPDTYCKNARETDLMMPDTEIHSSIIAKPDGNVLYSRESKIVSSCYMDLRYFPFDSQTCSLKFASYSYSAEDLIYKWKKNSRVEIEDGNLAQFVVKDVEEDLHISRYSTGNYSTFLVHFTFERRIGYYVMQVYIPCLINVIISWIIFWMDIEDTGNRVTVGITAVLTIMFLQSFVNSMMPKVSYVKAIDWYLIMSISFIFLALVFSVLIAYQLEPEDETESVSVETTKRRQRIGSKLADHLGGIPLEPIGRDQISTNHVEVQKPKKPRNRIAILLDRASRVAFPVSFIILNIAYWEYHIR